jgi:pimeloyl-ACP methyl ester carboxylesterase
MKFILSLKPTYFLNNDCSIKKTRQNTLIFLLLIVFVQANETFANKFYKTQTDTMITGNYANVNGIKMYYEIHGEGKPLVLIHGGGSTIETTFGQILPLFAQHYKVIAVELQAHGHSSDRNAPETFEQDADDVAALLKQLNIHKAYIFGFSNGGSTTMQIAIRHPEMVDKIVVASGAYLRDGFIPGFFDMMKDASPENMPQPLKDAYLEINPDTTALLNMHDKDAARMLAFKDWSDDDIQFIKAPALIINGDKDVVTTEHAVKMSRLIPNAELVILPGVHGAFLGEVCTAVPGSKLPEMTVQLVEEFLNK